jgi:hypothetical protein
MWVFFFFYSERLLAPTQAPRWVKPLVSHSRLLSHCKCNWSRVSLLNPQPEVTPEHGDKRGFCRTSLRKQWIHSDNRIHPAEPSLQSWYLLSSSRHFALYKEPEFKNLPVDHVLSQLNSLHALESYMFKNQFTLYSHLCLSLISSLLLSGLSEYNFYAFLISFIRSVLTNRFIILD